MKAFTHLTVVALFGAALVVAGPSGPASAAGCKSTVASDFNGDGIADAAITEEGTETAPGALHVLYGTRSGLTASSPQDALFTGDTNSAFGESVAVGDFNHDGCADLAIADPDATEDAKNLAGVVSIYIGSPAGLENDDLQLVASDAGGTVANLGEFGEAMATGDVNHDGFADLIIGSEQDTIFVFPGSADGITGGKAYVEGAGGVPGSTGGGNAFGNALATGDFDGDGRDDVAIGAPFEGTTGAVVVLRGGTSIAAPLTTTGAKLWTQDSPGVPGTAEADDSFGGAVATGDFKGNGRTDLAIGVAYEAIGDIAGAGTVDVLYSAGSSGLTGTGAQAWTQDSSGVPGIVESNDHFGAALASGDFNGNGRDDLAVGAFGESVGTLSEAGAVNVIPGSSSGLTGTGSSLWNQDTAGIAGAAEAGDRFGSTLTALRVTSSSRDDLLIGVPVEGLGATAGAGSVEFLRGSSHGVTASGSATWSDDTSGVKGASCMHCGFGSALG